jgi:hypothetical protein
MANLAGLDEGPVTEMTPARSEFFAPAFRFGRFAADDLASTRASR